MFKKNLPYVNKSLARFEGVEKNHSWMYVSAGVIVCTVLAVWYAALPEGFTFSAGQPSRPNEISTLSLANSGNTTDLARRKALIEEAVGNSVALDLTLAGVISSESSGGLALISISGQPAQPYAKGSYVMPGYMVQTIQSGRVMLAESLDKPVKSTLLLMTKSAVSSQSNPYATSSVPGVSHVTEYHLVPVNFPKALDAGPLPRADARYRFSSAVRHQHGHAGAVP
jgi:hypothetical protein